MHRKRFNNRLKPDAVILTPIPLHPFNVKAVNQNPMWRTSSLAMLNGALSSFHHVLLCCVLYIRFYKPMLEWLSRNHSPVVTDMANICACIHV